MNTRVAIVAALAVALVVAVGAGAWALSGPGDVERRGTCADATWTVDLEAENGDTEGSVEILTSATDETWTIRAVAGDQVVFDGERSSAEGEVEVDLLAVDTDPDELTITLVAPGGEECAATRPA